MAGFCDLPHDVLLQIAGDLSLNERHASLAGVSRRCWQLAHAPLLLHAVDVLLPASAADISWFFAWLTRHAALHVAQLSITIGCVVPPPPIDDVWDDDGDAPYPDSVLTALHYGLQACSALSQLAELRMTVHQDFELQNADFAALPGSLRRFEVGYPEFDDRTRELWLGGLQHLTALQQASFRGRPVRLAAPPSSLPPSLTSLALHGIQSATGQTNAVPEQITALTALRHLLLANPLSGSSAAFRRLTVLTALERLCLAECRHLPDCLAQLPRLSALRLHDTPFGCDEDTQAAALALALPPLASQLTHLALSSIWRLPSTVSELTHLECLYWVERSSPEPCLPPGPWLASLRQLAVSTHTAAASLDVLAGATQLDSLAIMSTGDEAADLRVAAWAGRHTSLCVLALSLHDFPLETQLRVNAAALGRLEAGLVRLQLPPQVRVLRGNALHTELSLASTAQF